MKYVVSICISDFNSTVNKQVTQEKAMLNNCRVHILFKWCAMLPHVGYMLRHKANQNERQGIGIIPNVSLTTVKLSQKSIANRLPENASRGWRTIEGDETGCQRNGWDLGDAGLKLLRHVYLNSIGRALRIYLGTDIIKFAF